MKLRVWASQLEASDFPPVCVFSGEAAETWWKLRARRPYLWALPFLILLILCGIGLVVSPPLGYLLSDRVTGHVPVKAKYLRRLRLLVGLSIAIIAIGVVIGVAGVLAAAGHNYSVAVFAPLLLTVGLLAVLMGITGVEIGLQLSWNPLAPRARVLKRRPEDPDRIVELFHLHPAFVFAASQMYAQRSAHSSGSK